MKNDSELLDEDMLPLLAEYDEQQAASGQGEAPVAPPDPVVAVPDRTERWQRLRACVDLLRRTSRARHAVQILPAEPAEQGSRALGRFQIVRELGRGGFGVVFLADDPMLGRRVALKVPRLEALADPGLRERFLREARAAASLDHPNVVPVYEAGQVGLVCYIVSAYCPGPTLAAWLRDHNGPVDPRWAAELVATLADAVQHAHDHGVFHRDLKPANVLLFPSAANFAAGEFAFTPRLTDFGLAKLMEADIDQTSSGVLLGTPPYMAPEQIEGWAAGPGSDIYALGVILYELLTGRLPFLGASVAVTLELIRAGSPESLRRLRPELSRDLETVCLTCVRRDPRQRFASAGELAADLRRFLAGQPVHARRLGFLGLVWNYCRRPERLRDAAFLVFFFAFANFLIVVPAFVFTITGLLPLPNKYLAAIYLLFQGCVVVPAQLWAAYNTIERRLFALWGGIGIALAKLSWEAAAASGLLPTGGLVEVADNPAMFLASAITALFATAIQILAFCIALVAYYANRHIPGFTPDVRTTR